MGWVRVACVIGLVGFTKWLADVLGLNPLDALVLGGVWFVIGALVFGRR